jgi:hypothetical protein
LPANAPASPELALLAMLRRAAGNAGAQLSLKTP